MSETSPSRPGSGPARPYLRGTLLAVLAAVSFGLTAPFVARAGQATGPFATGAILYFGAALVALASRRRSPLAAIRDMPPRTLVPMVLAGAVIAPAAFAWGLHRTGGTTGSLLLNLEAGFTVLLAMLMLGEKVSRRAASALVLIACGGVLIGLDASRDAASIDVLGVLAVALATASWALDNVLARRLSSQHPMDVVLAKGLLGSGASLSIALALREPWPDLEDAAVLLLCGAFGYGASLRLYLAAQAHIGAARTGSVFAVAPFVGAGLAWALGDRGAGVLTLAAAGLFALGIALHASEGNEPAQVKNTG
jgi:drug/metabolite transporter (DMT)-like permease